MNFKVGDVCVTVDPHSEIRRNKHLVGVECEIIGALGTRMAGAEPAYEIRYTDGKAGYAVQRCLRLKRPPSWDRWIYDTSGVTPEVELVSHSAWVAWTDRA